MLALLSLGLSPAGRGGPVRSTRCNGRSSVLRMAGASDRMAQDGVLYDGWGAEGLKSLNMSNRLLDHAEDVGVNRYDLTRIVAAQAKEIAYAHCTEDDMLNPMLSGNVARTPRSRVPHVMRAIKDLQLEVDVSLSPVAQAAAAKPAAKSRAKPSAKEARAGAAVAARGAGAGPSPAPSTSMDGDGGGASLQKLNQDLLDAEDAEQAAERLGTAAKAEPEPEPEPGAELSEDGFDQLLADLSEVHMEEDFDDSELDDAAIDDLFGSVVVDNGGSLESSGMHPGDSC